MNTNAPPSLAIERTMKAPAKRIYKAFLDPAILVQYQTPPGTEAIYGAFTAQVGAENKYQFKSGEQVMPFKIKFLELVEYTTIRHTYAFDMEGPMGVDMEILITLEENGDETLVRFQQWGIPEMIPADKAAEGWQSMLDRLAALVEA